MNNSERIPERRVQLFKDFPFGKTDETFQDWLIERLIAAEDRLAKLDKLIADYANYNQRYEKAGTDASEEQFTLSSMQATEWEILVLVLGDLRK